MQTRLAGRLLAHYSRGRKPAEHGSQRGLSSRDALHHSRMGLCRFSCVSTGLVFIGTIGSGTDRTQIILNTDGSINFYSQGASQVFNITSAAGVITTGNWFSSRRFAIEPRHSLFINGTQVTYGRVWYRNHGQQSSSGVWAYVRHRSRADWAVFDVQFSRRAEHREAYSVPTALLPFDGDKVAWIYDSVTAG